jgi:hypothetical protein
MAQVVSTSITRRSVVTGLTLAAAFRRDDGLLGFDSLSADATFRIHDATEKIRRS